MLKIITVTVERERRERGLESYHRVDRAGITENILDNNITITVIVAIVQVRNQRRKFAAGKFRFQKRIVRAVMILVDEIVVVIIVVLMLHVGRVH